MEQLDGRKYENIIGHSKGVRVIIFSRYDAFGKGSLVHGKYEIQGLFVRHLFIIVCFPCHFIERVIARYRSNYLLRHAQCNNLKHFDTSRKESCIYQRA